MKMNIFFFDKTVLRFAVFGLLFFNTTLIFSQINDGRSAYYKAFDAIVGVGNTGLYNGVEFEAPFNIYNNKHQFFKEADFSIGDVVYNGQPYFDVLMKYDTWQDDLIVKLPTDVSFHLLRLIPEKVERFNIYGADFINTARNDANFKIKNLGIIQVLFEGVEIGVGRKHRKIKEEKLNKEFYTLFEDKSRYYMFYKGKTYQVNSKKDIIAIIPEFKKEVKATYKEGRALKKSDYDSFLVFMTMKIDEFLQNKSQQEK